MKEQIKPELEDANKLIAEFMGMIQGRIVDEIGYYDTDELEYHSSWDWLMPVVEKIGLEYLVKIQNGTCTIFYIHPMGSKQVNISFQCEDKTIDSVYLAVLDFLEWYKLKGVNTNG